MAKWELEVGKKGIDVPDYVLPLIPGYLERRIQEVDVLKQHLMVGAYDPIRIIGHKLRGNGVGYGFEVISQLGAEIERAAILKDGVKLDSLILALESELVELTS